VQPLGPDDDLPEDAVIVPESRIEFSGGHGVIHYELVEDEEPATYRRSWFQKHGINPNRVRRFRVVGDSMEPMLFARDTILVNLDETQIVDGHVYALRYGEQLRVKYVSLRLDGTIVLRSVNPAYKDEEIPNEIANEHITIIGRVRDRSGTGGL
jgi:phage repressor protein C with HTH and peptisase S24 domain